MAPSASARARPPAMFLRASARVGCSSRGVPSGTPTARARRAARPGPDPGRRRCRSCWPRSVGRQLGAAQLVDGHVRPCGVVRWRREVGQVGTLPRQVVVMEQGRSPGAGRRHGVAAPVFKGSERRFSTMTRSASASAPSTSPWPGVRRVMASPGRTVSTGPAPATVRTVQPRRPSAPAHFAASMATPSSPPSRNETMHAVATGALYACRRARMSGRLALPRWQNGH